MSSTATSSSTGTSSRARTTPTSAASCGRSSTPSTRWPRPSSRRPPDQAHPRGGRAARGPAAPGPPSGRKPMLILDFDGVVCDAFEECAVVTWYATEDPETTAAKPVAELVSDLPASFLTRFRTVRKYSRLLHHFMVAHDPRSEAVSG